MPQGFVPLVAAPPPPVGVAQPPLFPTEFAPYGLPIPEEANPVEHKTETLPESEAKPEAPKTEQAKADGAKEEATKEAAATTNTVSWDGEKDAQLLKYKDDNRSWKQISALLDISVSELRRRFKELKQQQQGGTETNPDASKQASSSAEEAKPSGEPEQKEAPPIQQQATAVPGIDRYIYLAEDDIFSIEETLLLLKIAQQYDEDKWLTVSSRFYDHTGRRVHPDDVRAKIG
ncbi:hypothetical protein L228DRAFT_13469 [Xylona heveae TC161]|uniref:Myb-like domain-containing protein n=1 Tax=Xylona heveae (strain CBS 132557 / TC161) TaxID=1328760 RepID=A0A165JPM0_XYLHT|nr:hypothetical protein L228DRAFT_13469 [Xylona heveae TC161]KZF26488.1 hypothetical protein L228DRAFT_13469 [Xylona heveae TC161]